MKPQATTFVLVGLWTSIEYRGYDTNCFIVAPCRVVFDSPSMTGLSLYAISGLAAVHDSLSMSAGHGFSVKCPARRIITETAGGFSGMPSSV